MAACRAERWIQEAVESVRAQEELPGWTYELRIAVDACDATSSRLHELGVGHWWSPSNVGPFLLRNSLMTPDADALAIFDADDVMQPGYLSTLVPLAHPDAIAGAARIEINEKGQRRSRGLEWQRGVAVFSRGAMAKLGGFRPWRCAADVDAKLRADALGITIRRTREVFYWRRNHLGSLTRDPPTAIGSRRRVQYYDEAERLVLAGELHVERATVPLEWRAGR